MQRNKPGENALPEEARPGGRHTDPQATASQGGCGRAGPFQEPGPPAPSGPRVSLGEYVPETDLFVLTYL